MPTWRSWNDSDSSAESRPKSIRASRCPPSCSGWCARTGPALLFERVRGAAFPLVMNLFGSRRRIELALGRHPEADRTGADHRRPGAQPALARRVLALAQRAGARPLHATPRRAQRAGAPGGRGAGAHPAAECDKLAAGRRSVHHVRTDAHRGAGHRAAQLRPLPAPSLRRRHHRDALAEHEGGTGSPLRGRETRPAAQDGCRARAEIPS